MGLGRLCARADSFTIHLHKDDTAPCLPPNILHDHNECSLGLQKEREEEKTEKERERDIIGKKLYLYNKVIKIKKQRYILKLFFSFSKSWTSLSSSFRYSNGEILFPDSIQTGGREGGFYFLEPPPRKKCWSYDHKT